MSKEIKKILQDAIAKKRLKQLNDTISKNLESQVDLSEIKESVADSLYKTLEPTVSRLVEKDRITTQEIVDAINSLEVKTPEVFVPEMKAPIVNVPAPIVNVPAPIVNFPEIEFPEYPEFPTEISLRGVDKMTPLPVMMMDHKGKPMQMGSGGVAGGRGDFFTIKGFEASAFANLQNADGRIRVSVETGGSGLTDSELRATAVPVSQVSGASWSVSVTDVFGSTGANVINPDGRIKVELPTGSSGLTDTELRASAVPMSQVSGAAWSVLVTEVFGSTGTNVVNPDGRLKVELPTGSSGLTDTELRASSVPVEQVSGVAWSVSVTDVFGSTGANVINPDGRIKVELPTGSSGLTDTELRASSVPVEQVSGSSWSTNVTNSVTVGSITATVATANVDSTGVQYSGSNPLPMYSANTLDVRQVSGASNSVNILAGTITTVTTVTGITNSVAIVGEIASDVADTGNAPVKIGGIARTANPTAVAAGDRVSATYDDLGRQVFRPHQVRDLIVTAYVSVTNGTETTLLAASAGSFHDLIMLVGSNNSDAAVSVDIRAVTGGNIINTLRIPANGTAGFTPQVPWPQSDTGNNWTVDGPDETGRTITFSGLFSREV